jgi:DNA-binding transcriptional ArsR family regulator
MSRFPSEARLTSIFSALADPTRRRILVRLARGPASVSDVARPIKMSLPAVSKHLDILEQAGLVRREREGRIQRCHLEPRPLEDASQFIDRYRGFWDETLESLAKFVEGDE